jgi:hypothetical protein
MGDAPCYHVYDMLDLSLKDLLPDPTSPWDRRSDEDDKRAREYMSARTVQPPQTLYHYTKAAFAIDVLRSRRIRFGTPKYANDPFELHDPLWQLRTPEFSRALRARFRDNLVGPIDWKQVPRKWVDQWGKQRYRFKCMPQPKRDVEVEHTLDKLLAGHIADDGGPRARSLRFRARMLCLSQNPHSILMWSHYGDKHRGCVIGFRTSVLEKFWMRPVMPITYSPRLPELIGDTSVFVDRLAIDGRIAALPKPRVEEWICTKSLEWKYEQEWRFAWLAPPTEVYDHEFRTIPVEAVESVRLGAQMHHVESSQIRQEIQAAFPATSRIQVRLSRTAYELADQDDS